MGGGAGGGALDCGDAGVAPGAGAAAGGVQAGGGCAVRAERFPGEPGGDPAAGGARGCDLLRPVEPQSIIDGARLSRATIVVYEHCDVADAEAKIVEHLPKYRRGLLVTDGVFSMDGVAPLDRLTKVADRYDVQSGFLRQPGGHRAAGRARRM